MITHLTALVSRSHVVRQEENSSDVRRFTCVSSKPNDLRPPQMSRGIAAAAGLLGPVPRNEQNGVAGDGLVPLAGGGGSAAAGGGGGGDATHQQVCAVPHLCVSVAPMSLA